jgi:hypothetical protein
MAAASMQNSQTSELTSGRSVEQASSPYVTAFSTPWRFLLRMSVFVALIGFLGYILQAQIVQAFMANPGLNGLIAGVLLIGVVLTFTQVFRLFREVKWASAVQNVTNPFESERRKPPIILAPMSAVLKEGQGHAPLSPSLLRSLLDSLATRLDESREITRYMAGLLIFLGLLGTFWGLLETVGSIGKVISSMRTGADSTTLFDELKAGLAAPLAGMGISFSSSLFGLASSLIIGFLDLQTGQAQRRFYTEVEDWLSARVREQQTSTLSEDALNRVGERLALAVKQATLPSEETATSQGTTARAIVHLAEAVGGLVQQMRHEQQLIRDWVEAQAQREQEMMREMQNTLHETKALLGRFALVASSSHVPNGIDALAHSRVQPVDSTHEHLDSTDEHLNRGGNGHSGDHEDETILPTTIPNRKPVDATLDEHVFTPSDHNPSTGEAIQGNVPLKTQGKIS